MPGQQNSRGSHDDEVKLYDLYLKLHNIQNYDQLVKSNDCASAYGIYHTLQKILENKVHIIDPAITSVWGMMIVSLGYDDCKLKI